MNRVIMNKVKKFLIELFILGIAILFTLLITRHCSF